MITLSAGFSARGKVILARLKDANRWKESFKDLFLWLILGTLFLWALERLVPGHPLLVTTPSIPTGLYWLDRSATAFHQGDYATFEFKPQNTVLKARYAHLSVWHTKEIRATSGYRLSRGLDGRLTACSPAEFRVVLCKDAGVPKLIDSKGRDLPSWLPVNGSYLLKKGEVWVYGSHEGSLDSRYHGPVLEQDLKGVAKPLWIFSF